MENIPIACALTSDQLHERRTGLLQRIRKAALERSELPEGYLVRFAPESSIILEVAQLIDLERQCCPFLRFQLSVEPGGGPVFLEVTGSPGTKEFLQAALPSRTA